MTREPAQRDSSANVLKWALVTVGALLVFYLTTLMYIAGHVLVGGCVLGLYAIAAYIYSSRRALTYRYLFPGLAGIGVFVVFPLLFTVWIGFTEYGSRNLLTFERATATLLEQTYTVGEDRYEATLYRDQGGYRLLLLPEGATLPGADESIFDDGGSIFDDQPDEPGKDAEDAPNAADTANTAPEAKTGSTVLITGRLALDGSDPEVVDAVALSASGFTPGEPLGREFYQLASRLGAFSVRTPEGLEIRQEQRNFRMFSAERPRYHENPDGSLGDRETGATLRPDRHTGFYETETGERVAPGFRVFIGLRHYVRLFSESAFRQPFLRIFVWTVIFAFLSVLCTLIVGVLLGEFMQWRELGFRGFYRVLLFIPYAVPSFISILVFKGLFNQSFGEINQFLGMLLGLRPSWFTDPFLAKVMILIVNTWLGYPYIMLLWMGLKQSVPGDLYEAAAVDGAGPLTNFRTITWPLLWRPLMPLLVSSFAFNFNNFVLIKLLTDGRPDFLDTDVPAGTTDILVSYTYRIAFQATDKNFGLAAAISTVIFFIVAILAMINLRFTHAGDETS